MPACAGSRAARCWRCGQPSDRRSVSWSRSNCSAVVRNASTPKSQLVQNSTLGSRQVSRSAGRQVPQFVELHSRARRTLPLPPKAKAPAPSVDSGISMDRVTGKVYQVSRQGMPDPDFR